MARFTSNHVPAYQLHKHSGNAFVKIGGKPHYLGKYDTPASREKYNQLIGQWFAAGRDVRALQVMRDIPAVAAGATVDDVIAAFWIHAQQYYRKNGEPTDELNNFKDVLKVLRRLYGSTLAAQFGPLCLEACQQHMIAAGLSRKSINRRIGRIRQVFKWAVSKEMIPPGLMEGLRSVAGLKRGRTAAREMPKVKPVSAEHVAAVLPFCNRHVAAMIQIQLATGMRSGELVIMRTCDINRSDPKCWQYTPAIHKTEHHDHVRVVYIGEAVQRLLMPFLTLDAGKYLFSPAEAEAERKAVLTASRKTPLSCGNRIGTNRKADPQKKPGERYTPGSYAFAVTKACKRTFPAPDGLDAGQAKAWEKEHRFHPHQLRHTAGTKFRSEAGVETARIMLGQKSIEAAEIYAEADMAKAREFAKRVG